MSKNKDTTIVIVVTASVLLGFLMALSLVSTDKWDTSDINEIPMTDVANTLFNEYGVALVVLGILLTASVLGGIFLAREEVED
ncbi:MAG: NADH-quinone oxidoreductase subunit J [Methanomassiliicoccales archaeon]|nr:MAG: NADH-quinone oxidoreductase subunit J [Methanomassiliicoccales archaeon]